MDKLPVYLIGMGVDGRSGLSAERQNFILGMDEMWAAKRFLEEWPDFTGTRVPFQTGLREQVRKLIDRDKRRKIVVLGSGDPNFYGISRLLGDILEPGELIVYPNVSSLQVAFARASIPWDDAALTSLHTKPIHELIELARRHSKIGVLTEPAHSPFWICQQLLQAGIPDCRVVVCEDLGGKSERILDTTLSKLEDQSFASLNVMLLLQKAVSRPAFAPREDEAYAHERGLITKRDVRLLSLDRLAIQEDNIVWDIGAGSGAVSVEMSELAWRGKVYAIEKNEAQQALIQSNKAKFGRINLDLVPGTAPQALVGLPVPQAVFMGGSGGNLTKILEYLISVKRLSCRLVANFTLLENLLQAMNWLEAHQIKSELTSAAFSYGQRIGGGTRLSPINPVFILSCCLNNKEREV